MSNYIRLYSPGSCYFFTVATYQRKRMLTEVASRDFLRTSIEKARTLLPFEINAWVLMPDHMHCLWTLPEDDADFSKRWGLIKAGFSKQACSLNGQKFSTSASRMKHRESNIWQRRFWEHQIRNQDDFNRHVDYIHWNPVKHGLVRRAIDWPYSSFHRYVKKGVYCEDWGVTDEVVDRRKFGE